MRMIHILLLLSMVLVLVSLLTISWSQTAKMQGRGGGAINIKVEDGKEVKLYDRSYALVIGVSDYMKGWPKLPGVKKDIEEVARALEHQGFLVTKVENPDSSRLEQSFKEFIDTYGLGVENRLLFYFAGHGHTIKQSYGEEMGYIVPVNAPNPNRDPAGFMSTAMDMQHMELYARRIQSKHALFIFDSCFSGSFFALSRAVPDAISYKTARPVRQFITSGSADEQVPDMSIFRGQFIEAIEGEADLNRDGYVTGTELGEFLQDKVINYSRNTQHPQYGKIRNPNLDKGDFVFALPKVLKPSTATANPSATPAPLSPPTKTLTDNTLTYDQLIDRANSAVSTQDYNGAIRYAQQAAQLDPQQPTAYVIIGTLALYYSQNVSTAEQAMRAAIERGGAAAFHVYHDHNGSFGAYCEGSLFVTKTGVSFKANDGRDSFEAEDSNIKEAKINAFVGSQFGAFHIKPVQKINGRDNFVLAPNTRTRTESELILRLIAGY